MNKKSKQQRKPSILGLIYNNQSSHKESIKAAVNASEKLRLSYQESQQQSQISAQCFMQNWTQMRFHKLVPERRGYHASFIHKKKLYIHGGYDIKDGSISSLWSLDIENLQDAKELVASQNDYRGSSNSMYGPSSQCADQLLQDFGWIKIQTQFDIAQTSQQLQRKIQNLNLEKRIILKKPQGITRHTIQVYYDSIYLYGGSNGFIQNRLFYKMDLNTNTWEILDYFEQNSQIQPRDSHSAVVMQEYGIMIIFGGFIEGERTNEVLIYNFKTKIWQSNHRILQTKNIRLENYLQPCPRDGHSMSIYKNNIYVFGGKNHSNQSLNDLWVLNPQNYQWQQIKFSEYDQIPKSRNGHSCEIFKNYMIIFGGLHQLTKELNDMHAFCFERKQWINIIPQPNQNDYNNSNHKNIEYSDKNRIKTGFMNSLDLDQNFMKIENQTLSQENNLQYNRFQHKKNHTVYQSVSELPSNNLQISQNQNLKIQDSNYESNSLQYNNRNQEKQNSGRSLRNQISKTVLSNKNQSEYQVLTQHNRNLRTSLGSRPVTQSKFNQRNLLIKQSSKQSIKISLPSITLRPQSKHGEKNYGYGFENEFSENRQSAQKGFIQKKQNIKIKPNKSIPAQQNHKIEKISEKSDDDPVKHQILPSKEYLKKKEAQNQAKSAISKIQTKKNPLQALKVSVNKANIEMNMQKFVSTKYSRMKMRAEAEAKANIYGFQKNLLQSPTSIKMLHCYSIEKADMKWDSIFQQIMKKKKLNSSPTQKEVLQDAENQNQLQLNEQKQSSVKDENLQTSPELYLKQKESVQDRYNEPQNNLQVGIVPQSRDGHTGLIYQGLLIVFGGDRHHMPFNDTFVFDIEKEFIQRGLL